MTREIKFKCWFPKTKRMTELFVLGQSIEQIENTRREEDGIYLQFTGLLDKNGKEIYEGDIIEFAIENNTIKGEVEYLDNWAMFRISTGNNKGVIYDDQSISLNEAERYYNNGRFRIIGNIYEDKK